MPMYIVRPYAVIICIQENRTYRAANERGLLIGRDLSLGGCRWGCRQHINGAPSKPRPSRWSRSSPGSWRGLIPPRGSRQIVAPLNHIVAITSCRHAWLKGAVPRRNAGRSALPTALGVAAADASRIDAHSIRGLGPSATGIVATTTAGRLGIDHDSGPGDGRTLVCIAWRIAIGCTCFCARCRGTTCPVAHVCARNRVVRQLVSGGNTEAAEDRAAPSEGKKDAYRYSGCLARLNEQSRG